MTDREIHDAFERMKPDEAAKDRMLENILAASQPKKNARRKGWKRSLLLAAALAAGLSVAAAAYGTDFFGLWSVGMRNREIYSPVEVEEGVFVPGTEVVDEVSMQGLMDSPEAQAAREYEEFCSTYDPDGQILAETDFFLPSSLDYEAYTCYTQEMIDELDRLCEKYGLALLGPSTGAFEEQDLFDSLGTGNVCRGSREAGRHYFTWGYYYAGGSYMFEGSFVWNDSDGRCADYQFNCAAKGYLSTLFLNVGDLDDYEQWKYTTADGVPLLLALGPSKGLIFADTEKSFVTVNVLGDWAMGIFDLDRGDLEDIADGFDFSALDEGNGRTDGLPGSLMQGGEPEAPASSGQKPVQAAYRAVLEDILYDHKFPDGEDHGYDEPLSEDANQFALFDVDQDGREELIITYTSTPLSSGMTAFVLDYDEAAETVRIEFSNFPLLTFYDNGVIQADWSHNQGRAGDSLWPYTFWRYEAETDTYIAGESVDAWDQSLVEEGFPDSADIDGDGVVYYIMPYGSYDTSQPVDGLAYRQWRDSYIGGAQALRLPLVPLNEENVRAVT